MAYLALYSSMVLRMMANVDACGRQFAARLPKVNPAMAEASTGGDRRAVT